jgi:hypothetical protein
MMVPDPREVSALLVMASQALAMTQETMGQFFGVSRRTISRWQLHGTSLSPDQVDQLARAVYPINGQLAATIAALRGATLESLGIAQPAKPVEPPPPPTPPPRVVEVVLCAAAEALDASPRLVRPAVVAAFEAARDTGLGVEQVLKGLARRPGRAPPAAGNRKRPRSVRP